MTMDDEGVDARITHHALRITHQTSQSSSIVHRPSSNYPSSPASRTRWILERRGPKNPVDPGKPYAYLWEEEAGPDGSLIPTATVFLTNTECPFRCVMCDLWRNTLDEPTPLGAIPAQIDFALNNLPPARQIKLYNAGNFFDERAIPRDDYPAISDRVSGFERVIVECHPALIGKRCLRFRDLISCRLEVAVGLETAHDEVLAKLNKHITVVSFQRAAVFLAQNEIDLRIFLLLRPPFMTEEEGVEWARRSLEVAFDAGATACTLIPTRGGNGAMERLADIGEYSPPTLASLEAAEEFGLGLNRGRVFSDLWDIEKFYDCECSEARAKRLELMNSTQTIPPPTKCPICEYA